MRSPVHTLCAAALAAGLLAPAAEAAVTIDPPARDFGRVVIGMGFATTQFVLTNDTGVALDDVTLTIATTSAPPGAAGAPFALDPPLPSTHCTDVWPIAPGDTCTIETRFDPDQPGTYQGELEVFAEGAQVGPTVLLSGTAVRRLELPPALDFGLQPLATLGAARTITVTVNGSQTVGPARSEGAAADDFLITSNGCSGVVFAADATCDLRVRFAPSAEGRRDASLVVTSGPERAATALTGAGGQLSPAPRGEDGAPGPSGPQGSAGDRGADGAPGSNGAPGPAAPTAGPSRPAALVTGRARLVGDSIALRVRCPPGASASTGTVTLRTRKPVRGARRNLGTAAFGCRAGRASTVHLIVRSSVRRKLRRHSRRVRLVASIFTRGHGTVRQSATALLLAPAR